MRGNSASTSEEASVNVSGDWAFVVETTTTKNPRAVTVRLAQTGNVLEGNYSSFFGSVPVKGSIAGRQVEFNVTLTNVYQRQIDVVYKGRVDEAGKMHGTLVIPEPEGTGTFVADRV